MVVKKHILGLSILVLLVFSACKKDTRYVYEVQDQTLYQNSSQKQTLKTTAQFITIAYSDLFNSTITIGELNKLNVALQAFGDKGIVQDMIVKSFLYNAGMANKIPANTIMRQDVRSFVNQTYLKFYNRNPTEFESWKMQDLINQNTDMTPEMVYYATMTSEEYKYY